MVLRRGLFSNALHSFLRFETQTRRGHKPRRGSKGKNEFLPKTDVNVSVL